MASVKTWSQEKLAEAEAGLREMSLMGPEDHLIEAIGGDYWERFLGMHLQTRGYFYFTTSTIAFVSGMALVTALTNPSGAMWSLRYADVKRAQLCNVGPLIRFLPTGILLHYDDKKKGKENSYRISILKRKEWLAFLQEKQNQVGDL